MEEATTSDASEGTTEDIQTPELESETAGNTNSEEPSQGPEFDLRDVPEEARNWARENGQKYFDREFKRYLTKYTQERSAENKQRENELQTYKQYKDRYDELEKEIVSALRDPEYYNKVRRDAGFIKDEQPAKLESVDDLHAYLKRQEEQIKQFGSSVEEKAARIAQEKIAQHDKDQRYISAVSRIESEKPVFAKYKDLIISRMKEKFMDRYDGKNEYDVLKFAAEDFERILSEESEAKKQELIQSQKLKKQATTLTPQKKVSTKSVQDSDLREDVIARVRRRMGEA